MTVTELREALQKLEAEGRGGNDVVVYEGGEGTPLAIGIYAAGPRLYTTGGKDFVLIDSVGDEEPLSRVELP